MKQNTLWDMEVEKKKKPLMMLYPPLPNKQNECYRLLQAYTVPVLKNKFLQLRKMLLAHQPVMQTPAGEAPLPPYLWDAITKKANLNKEELLRFVSFFISEPRNFGAYIDSLDEDVRKVWTFILENYFAGNKLLQSETGKVWMEVEKQYYYSAKVRISEELPWFFAMRSILTDYKLDDYYLYLPMMFRPYLYPVFLAQKINSCFSLTDLPQEEPLRVFNEEKQIFKLLPLMESLYKQKMLQVAKYRISASALNKAGKLLNACEFFPDDADKTASRLRTFMLLSAYGIYRSMSKEADEPEMLIKKLIEKTIQYPGVLLAITLPHINGVKLGMLSNSYASLQAQHILQLLATDEPDKWRSVENIRLKLYGLEENGCQNVLFTGNTLQRAEFVNAKQNKKPIMLEDIYPEMGVPFIKGFLLLLASLGALEVAYDNYDPESVSYCCSLRYVRLTPLGKYVLGLQKDYTPQISGERFFEVNPDDLIVRSISEDNPYEALLTDIATPIGRHRYKVTFGSFLANCTKQSDIEEKISFFKKHVCKQPPQNWKDFFNTLLQYCHPLKMVNEEKYYIYQLKPQDKELQRLVSTDSYLRQYTKRGEDYLLLIETMHLREVINRLKTFGYLL